MFVLKAFQIMTSSGSSVGAVCVYISMISQDGGFLIWADQHGMAWALPVKLGATPEDCVCKCLGRLSEESGFCGVHDMVAGAAGASAAGVTAKRC